MKPTPSRQRWILGIVLTLLLGLVVACSSPAPEAPAEEPAAQEQAATESTEESEEQAADTTAAGTEESTDESAETSAEMPLGASLIGELEGPEIITDPAMYPTEFNEAPQLAEMVEAGELPPVEERIGQDPLVIAPLDEIGQYGGVWRRGFTGPGDGFNSYRCCSGTDHPLFFDYTATEIVPNLFKDWEFNEDGTVITLYLRNGMKWSDGAPFTADDIMFWYEDIYQNTELVPVPSRDMEVNGEQGVIEKIDDFTIQITFAGPYFYFAEMLSSNNHVGGGQSRNASAGMGLYSPKHYLSQFHPDYVGEDEANALAVEAGFEDWVQLFKERSTWTRNPDLPVVSPWMTTVPSTEPVWILERNPYYFGVDTEGNQLPYIDRVEMTLAENLEVINLRAIAGEYDLQARHLDLAKLPVFLENAETGGYNVNLDPGTYGADFAMLINHTYDADSEIAKWLHTTDFRRALSLGIDRDELNEVFWLGLGVPGSAAPGEDTPYSPGPEYRTLWATHDPDTANQMLDDLGLTEKDSEGFRLRTDNGERLSLTILTYGGQFIQFTRIAEMISEHLRDIGIELIVQEVERSLGGTMIAANEVPIAAWNNDGSDRFFASPWSPVIPVTTDSSLGPLIGQWYQSAGAQGRAPEGLMAEAFEMFDQAYTVPDDERVRLGQEIWKLHIDEVWSIGTVGLSPASMGLRVTNVNLGNVPGRMYNAPDVKNPAIARPQTFYFKNLE